MQKNNTNTPIANSRPPRIITTRPSNSAPDQLSSSSTTIKSSKVTSIPYIHPKPLKVVQNYEMIKTIGQGSMGKVKLGRHQITGQLVAIKVIPRFPDEITKKVSLAHRKRKAGLKVFTPPPIDLEYDSQRELRILREGFTLKLVNHTNIVELLDFCTTRHYYYLIFEYVDGTQLLDVVVTKGRMPALQAREVMRQIFDAVEYCHSNSIVHRDLKIENIMMERLSPSEAKAKSPLRPSPRRKSTGSTELENIRIKILDFGLGNFTRPDRLLKTFCGSLYFAAPELLQARPYAGPEVDMWSLGVIAYVLLCGTVPFDDASLPALHAKIKSGKVSYPEHLTSASRHFLSRLLCVNPRSRATIHEIKDHPWILNVSEPLTFVSNAKATVNALVKTPYINSTISKMNATLVNPTIQNQGLIGQQPNPMVVCLMKMSPYKAACLDLLVDHTQMSTISQPSQCGFGAGFGYNVDEVDLVLEQAFTNKNSIVMKHPVVCMYRMILDSLIRQGTVKTFTQLSQQSQQQRQSIAATQEQSNLLENQVPQPINFYF